MAYTTIQVTEETREKLAKLKTSPRESYDELICTLLEIIPSRDDEGVYSEDFKASLLRALADIKGGHFHSLSSVRKQLGV